MASHWRRYAETHAVTIPTTGGQSWERIVATHFGVTTLNVKGSWAKHLYTLVVTAGSPGAGTAGSYTRRVADRDTTLHHSAAKGLVEQGGRAPLT